jgi:type I restriction enzyme, S subunit
MEVEPRIGQEALFETPSETPKVEDLPDHWVLSPLSAALQTVKARERAVSIEDEKTYRLLTVKLYAKGITLRSKVNGSQIGVSTLYKTHPEDFIVSKIDARNGAWGFVPDHLAGGLVSGDFPIFRLNEDVADADFLSFILSQPRAWEPLKEQAIGSTGRRRVQASDFLEIEIPLPPLSEQKAIAAALRAVRDSREATVRALEEAKAFKRSLMRHVFTFGPVSLEEAATVELQETAIGSIPKDWDVKRIGDVVRQSQYGLSIRADVDGEIPMLRMGNLQGGEIIVEPSSLKYASREDSNLEKFGLEIDDIIFNRTNSIDLVGKTSIFKAEGEFTFASYLIRLKTIPSAVSADFFNLFMNLEATQMRLKLIAAKGVSQANISASKLGDFLMSHPDLTKQNRIMQLVSPVIDFEKQLESRLSSLDALFQSLLYHLMTGRVRVPASTTGDA